MTAKRGGWRAWNEAATTFATTVRGGWRAWNEAALPRFIPRGDPCL